MTSISPVSAQAPLTAALPVQPVTTAEAAPSPVSRKVEEAAPIALASNDMSRVVMDARAEYSPVNAVGEARGNDFDRLEYVLAGFEHMRKMIQAGQAQPENTQAPGAAAPLFAEPAVQGIGGGMDITM